MHPGQTSFFSNFVYHSFLLMLFTSSAIGKYRRSCSLGTWESIPSQICWGISLWLIQSLSANNKLIWLKRLCRISDSTFTSISGSGLCDNKSASDSMLWLVWTEDVGIVSCNTCSPDSSLNTRTFKVALQSINRLPGACYGFPDVDSPESNFFFLYLGLFPLEHIVHLSPSGVVYIKFSIYVNDSCIWLLVCI